MLIGKFARTPGMFGSIHRDGGRCARGYALVVLISIFSLTLQVATRFTLHTASASTLAKSLHKQAPRSVHPRLNRDSANWIPPAVTSTVYRGSSAILLLVPAGPETPNRPSKSSLFTRPPPFSYLL